MTVVKSRPRGKRTALNGEDVLVSVTKKGQVTIPVRLRKKYDITEASVLAAKDTGNGVLLVPQASIFDYAGCLADVMTPEEGKRKLDALREEDRSNAD
jgi:bifunctional DNA-binding transcriptional regulator/antitoxin component of YhaV-PrlF toxin-antitoxin module